MSGAGAAVVVASYRDRARFARAETAAVAAPRLLPELLAGVTHAAELPCGGGYFLAGYRRAEAAVTLIDASPAMLATALDHAHELGLASTGVTGVAAYLQPGLRLASDVDLVVIPNAALNQLACQRPIPQLWAVLRAAVPAGCTVLAQVACVHDGRVDTTGFYDPDNQHGVWFVDRNLGPHDEASDVVRARRQHRTTDRLRIELDYRAAGRVLLSTEVQLRLFTADAVTAAAEAAGFHVLRVLAGHGTLSELVLRAAAVDR